MTLQTESLIAHTLTKMHARITATSQGSDEPLRNQLFFTGNLHDAIPRRLLLDTRLSPLDKIGWMMIRLYAQQNEGAIFPSYDELQHLLTSPGNEKASRETVSRVLMMLRITGWLSLCKRVRDDKGRIRGNIYAQHDEPLTFCDAETLDPRWLDTVTEACFSKNKTISQTAYSILNEVKSDPTMRHYRSHISLIETRLDEAKTPQQMLARQPTREMITTSPPSSVSELSENKPSSDTDPGKKQPLRALSSDPESSATTGDHNRVRDPTPYVRNLTQSVNKTTYVTAPMKLPTTLSGQISAEDLAMLNQQLQALPEAQAQLVLQNLQRVLKQQTLKNPVGWLLTVLKKARNGALYPAKPLEQATTVLNSELPVRASHSQAIRKSPSPEKVHDIVAAIKATLTAQRARSP